MADFEKKLGDYLILERIAQGGMAQVYKAKTVDPNGIERLVVIKRILPHISSNPEYVEMLIDEAKIAVHFTHGNIAQVYDLGKVGEDYFIVMEYVDGKTLGQIVREFKQREKPIPLDILLYCVSELCLGLDYIHRKTGPDGKPLRVVHRDVSPQNIIVSYSGTVKIIDFGVAKAEEKMSQTESGVLKGKFAYMSPEQADGRLVDCRSDLFSAGTLLWELVTQERLFKKKSNMETVKAVRKARFQPASKIRLDLPRSIDKIISKALQKRPSRRYQTAAEMGGELNRVLLEEFPDFKPINVAEFLYRYFGPEPDEENLPAELPQLEVKKEERLPKAEKGPEIIDEEETEVDRLANFLSFIRPSNLLNQLKKIEWNKNKPRLFGLASLVLAFCIGFGVWGFIRATAKGTLILEVKPPDAVVILSSEKLKQTQGSYLIKKRSGVEIFLKISRKGYFSHEEMIVLKRKETRTLNIALKKDIPPYGHLIIKSDPLGATIYLDDIEWNRKTPAEIPRLKSGKIYKLGLYLDNYKFLEKEITFKPGETKNLKLHLKIDYASLEINSSPQRANVIIDDQIVGTTPYKNLRINPGSSFELALDLTGYQPITKELTLEPGEKMTLTFELQKELQRPEE